MNALARSKIFNGDGFGVMKTITSAQRRLRVEVPKEVVRAHHSQLIAQEKQCLGCCRVDDIVTLDRFETAFGLYFDRKVGCLAHLGPRPTQ